MQIGASTLQRFIEYGIDVLKVTRRRLLPGIHVQRGLPITFQRYVLIKLSRRHGKILGGVATKYPSTPALERCLDKLD